MQIKEESIIKRKNKVFKKVKKKTFVLGEENDELFELNPSAGFIWKNISKPIKFRKLVDLMTEKFDVAENRARKDLKKTLTLLNKKKLIIIKKNN